MSCAFIGAQPILVLSVGFLLNPSSKVKFEQNHCTGAEAVLLGALSVFTPMSETPLP